MSDLLLTDDERERFATWLELEALTSAGIANQLATMHVPVTLVEHEKMYATSCRLIAKKLRSAEKQSLGGER